jgi:hypothetical protein
MVGRTSTGGRAESGYFPAVIETARIVNVNVNDWSVDAVSAYGNRRFFDVQVMSPYLHYFNGEGIYVMPEVGALCWVCQESTGLMANHFVLGFQAPVDERVDRTTGAQAGNFKANRQNLNPGDIMMRTRDENFIILRRGGVVQIGATPATQRMYIPIGNIIRDFCENYSLFTLAGDMEWQTDRVDQSDAGEVSTRFVLRSKTKANEPEHAVVVTLGSQKDSPDIRLSLVVNESGVTGAPAVVQMTMDKAGSVSWSILKDFTFSSKGKISLTTTEADMLLEATNGKMSLIAGQDLAASVGGNFSLKAKGSASIESSLKALVKAPQIDLDGKVNVGGAAAKEPMVLGLKLVQLLLEIIDGFTNPQKPFGLGVTPGMPMVFPGLLSALGKLQLILSTNNKTS